MARRVLVTRPAPDGPRTAERLAGLGFDPMQAPLSSLREVPDLERILGAHPTPAGLAVTSAVGLRILDARLAARPSWRNLPLFAVGDRTASEASQYGFADVRSAAGDLDALAALIRATAWRPGDRLLHAAGEDRAGDLSAAVGPSVTVETLVLYRMLWVEALPAEAADAWAGDRIHVVLHYSPRAAAAFVRLAAHAGRPVAASPARHVALSRQVGLPLVEAGVTPVIALKPDEVSLLDALSGLCGFES